MELYQWAIRYPNGKTREREFDFLREASYGKTYFSPCTSLGAIGCTMSHLSVLQDAYDSGHETIWVMEDDIDVKANPHYLSDLIDKLDQLVGKEGWDVFYTDIDAQDHWLYSEKNDFQSDLRGLRMDIFWRPDLPYPNFIHLTRRTPISADFLRVGSRMRTHSMIIRRSGIEKILKFEKEHGMFVPIDHEIALVPGIRLYSLRYLLVTSGPSPSDTHERLLD
jgi:GR25 family glycosyltransferase involved in LPS biosynthesis